MGGPTASSGAPCAQVEHLEARLFLAVIPVSTFDDVVNPSDGLTSLREAIATASATQGDDLILLPTGIYPLTLGQLSITDFSGVVRMHSSGGHATLDAQRQSRVLRIQLSTEVALNGLVLTNGRAASSCTDSGDIGGGIYNLGTLSMIDCTVTGNASGSGASRGGIGGGIYNEGRLTMINCAITRNATGDGATQDGGHGGGIFNNASRADPVILQNCRVTDNVAGNGGLGGGWGGGIATQSGTLIMTECVVTSNRAGDGGSTFGGSGGGVAGTLQGNLVLTRCTIAGNVAGNGIRGGEGGGVFAGGGTLTLEESIVHKNVAGTGTTGGGGGGGGISSTTATAVLNNCAVTANRGGTNNGNTSGGQGGAIRNLLGTVTLHGCTLSGNSGGDGNVGGPGGGIHNSQGVIRLVNCTVSTNSAGVGSSGGAPGGGFYNAGSGTISLVHCTVTGNSARRVGSIGGVGGGIRTIGAFSLANTIVADNFAESDAPDVSGTVSSHGYNLIGSPAGSAGWISSDLLNVIPRLEPLADNGGPTLTHALHADSPARDQGRSFRHTVDQRGDGRPFDDPNVANSLGGDGSDIGAVETQPLGRSEDRAGSREPSIAAGFRSGARNEGLTARLTCYEDPLEALLATTSPSLDST